MRLSIHSPICALLLTAITILVGCINADVQVNAKNVASSVTQQQGSTPTTPQTVTSTDAATLKKGEIMFLRCRSCHSTEKDGPHLTGPNLNGLFGASAGSKEGFAFSAALTSSDIVWNAETLDDWIERPSTYVPENMMVFAGMPNADNRAALIAYLAETTQ